MCFSQFWDNFKDFFQKQIFQCMPERFSLKTPQNYFRKHRNFAFVLYITIETAGVRHRMVVVHSSVIDTIFHSTGIRRYTRNINAEQ